MKKLIRQFDNRNRPIVDAGDATVPHIHFNLIRLPRGGRYATDLAAVETVWVVLEGNADIRVDRRVFANVGRRETLWSGKADSVYAGIGSRVSVESNQDRTEIAVAGGTCAVAFEPFRIAPGDVEAVDVGSSATKSHRRIEHILGQNAAGRAGNLLVSELYCEEGCWSGYPPHKHDEENPPDETAFEELYHYRFQPGNGFGGQFWFDGKGEPEAFMTRNGDTFAFAGGYHPTVTSPGHAEYIFTVLVGNERRSLIQNFHGEYRHLMDRIPGIAGMREKFK